MTPNAQKILSPLIKLLESCSHYNEAYELLTDKHLHSKKLQDSIQKAILLCELQGRSDGLDTKQLTFFDFFSGIGGFRIGLERAGFKCIGYCDNDKYANKLYSNYYDTIDEVFFDDITKIRTEELPDFDIF